MRWILVVAMLLWPAAAGAQTVGMGEQVFARCAMCHEIGAGAKSRQGPLLTGVLGRRAASVPDFPYSQAMRQDRDNGLIWTPETMAGFIGKPKHFEPGTGMIFPGLKNEADIADVIAYITTFQTQEAIALQLGGSLLEIYCSSCHAIGPEGESPHDQAPPFRTLHERYDVGDLEEALVEGLVSGHPDMPEFEFPPEQASAIVWYLKSLE
jgi:cytochrome c